jgi:hypothetical protein
MAMSDHKAKDAAMAAYMKKHPGSFPDSVMRPHPGNGSDLRTLSKTMGNVPNAGSKWNAGMLGGVLAARLGFGVSGIPKELL